LIKHTLYSISICILLLFFPIIGSSTPLSSEQSVPLLKNQQTNNETYDLLLVTASYYTSLLTQLQDHKNTLGIVTKIIDIQDIYNGAYFPTQGRDQPEQIKYFLKNAYDTWHISYVLFFGSKKIIPLRFVSVIPDSEIPSNYTSELYYADLYDAEGNFSTWDSDNDGVYLEWYNQSQAEDVQQDLTPEIAIGRISFSSAAQAKMMISKIITYETDTRPAPWFDTMVVAGGDTFLEYEGYEGEVMTQNALDVMSHFTPKILWASNGKLDRFGLSIVRAINQGCGFLYIAGHGSSNLWGTFDAEGNAIGFFSSLHTLALLNGRKLPVCILSGCWVNKIEKDLCLGTALTRRGTGGAIAALGPTNVGYCGFEYNGSGLDFIELQFFKEYANGSRVLGDIWKACLTKSLETFPIQWDQLAGPNSSCDAKMVSEWIIIGDPSLHIRDYTP
jgi:hypothetical protein